MTRYSPIAAVLVLVAVLVPLIVPNSTVPSVKAQDVIMAPEGGRLEARDAKGQVIGPCPLKGTDVDVAVSGRFTRVTIRQKFHNPYDDKIEAVYTFPMSHRAAVDQMVMTVGDRVVVGEVKERQRARRIYQAARDQGYVASLLEQERPNIFTQSVANIEPGAEIDVQISYVELLESKDGTFSFDFPMVVEPRYIPGTPKTSPGDLAGKFKARRGVVVLGPAGYRIVLEGDTTTRGRLGAEDLAALMKQAQAIESPDDSSPDRKLMVRFEASYAGGKKETGEFYTDGCGHVNGRWFCVPTELLTKPGAPFAPDTDQVPDASKITPMPVRPEQRAGHDISINVTIDTGGPGIIDLKTPLHETIQTRKVQRDDGAPRKLTVELKKERDIPNRDFVLTWRQTADTIEEATFTHTGKQGKFFSLILQPPARVTDAQAVARELVFVLDTSGSMSGFPIEKAKEVMTKAIAAMRPQDTFNVITFSGDTHILWDKPQPGTKENVAAAQNFVGGQRGGGGTEMMTAIEAALMQSPSESAPPVRICCFMTDGQVGNDQAIIDAVKRNAKTTRVFSFGIGNSVNRYLLDGMARAGRGEVEYVLLNTEADAAVQRFSQRIQTPVLTDVELVFSDGLKVTELVPKTVPDMFDVKPIIVHGRYTTAGTGTLTIRGRTGSGRYERTIPLELPAEQPEHDTIATLWARAKVEALMNEDLGAAQTGRFPKELHDEVVKLGEAFGIMTQYTSFVAVEKQRVTVGGKPRLVHVPIEMAQGVSFEGIFGLDAVMPRRIEGGAFYGYGGYGAGGGMMGGMGGMGGGGMMGGMGGMGGGMCGDGGSGRVNSVTNETTLRQARLFMRLSASSSGALAGPVGPPANAEGEKQRLAARRDVAGPGMDNIYTAWGRPVDESRSGVTRNLWTLNRARGGWYDASMPQSAGEDGLYDFDGDGAGEVHNWSVVNGVEGRGGGGGGAKYDVYMTELQNSITKPPTYGNATASDYVLQYSQSSTDAEGRQSALAPTVATRLAASGLGMAVTGYSGKGETTRTYAVHGVDLNETAVRLDGALVRQYGFDAPFVKALPETNRLIISGSPAMCEEAARILAIFTNGAATTQPAEDTSTTTRPAGPVLKSSTLRLTTWLEALAAEKKLEDARQALLPQRVVIQAAESVKSGDLDDAKALIEALVKFDGEFKIGARMHAVLVDEKLAVADRDQQIAALVEEAKRAFDPVIRDIKLRMRLDGKLYPLAAAGPAAATQPAPEGVELKDGKVRVTVLAADTQAATLDALRKAGLAIEGSAERSNLVVGLVAREQLGDLGVLEQVKRIEPTEPLE